MRRYGVIKKIISIKNVGRFRDYSCHGGSECEFNQNTIIYGDNARGKSTFTAILRSLSTNKPDYIIGRKSFGSNTNPEVSILMDSTNSPYTFTSNHWSTPYPNILIFDSCFVNKNVYWAESITEENEKSIESIILGETGKQLHDALLEAEKNCQDNTNRKTAISREYSTYLGHYSYLFENFRIIKIDPDINSKIEELEKEIKANQSRQKIVDTITTFEEKIKTEKLSLFEIDLTPTIKLEQAEIKKHILENFNDINKAGNFLSTGKNLLKPKTNGIRKCVFCSQPLSDSAEKLVDEYELLFSKSYEDLTSSLKTSNTFFNNWNIENEIRQFIAEMQNYGITFNFEDEIRLINENITKFQEELTKKIDLNYQINFEAVKTIINTLVKIKSIVDPNLVKYKIEQTIEQKQAIQTKKKILELTQLRGEESWVKKCVEYDKLEVDFQNLTQKRTVAFDNKNKYSEDILKKYEGIVNDILKSLRANFKLVDTKPKNSIRSSTRLFNIAFDTHKVSLTNTDSLPCFANSLSESDKRVLAFAFFLATIKTQNQIDQKIVILDDPVSSFDCGRKRDTSITLRKFFEENKPKQLIFLTHDDEFLSMLVGKFSSTKYFKINYDPSTDNSTLIPMDPSKEFVNDGYYQHLETLKTLETAPDNEITWDKLDSIRICLEELFKKKYFFHIRDLISTQSIGSYMTRLKEKNLYDDQRISQINDLMSSYWHHDDSTATISKTSYKADDLRNIVTDFFRVIEII